MKIRMSRVLSLILCAVMLFNLCPQMSFAADTAKDYEFNYMKLYYGPWSTYAYAPSYVTDFAMTTAGSATEINKTVKESDSVTVAGIVTDPWMYDSVSSGAVLSWTASSKTHGPCFEGTAGEYAAYRIRIGAAGNYDLISRFSTTTVGGRVKIYLAPAATSSPRADRFYIGTINSYASAISTGVEEQLCTKALTAGDYVLSYVFDDSSDLNAGKLFLYTSAFLAKYHQVVYSFNAGSVSVDAGSKYEKELTLTQDGTAIDFTSASDLRVVSDNASIATASLSRSADRTRVYLTVNGVKEGLTGITISATIAGETKTEYVPVVVTLPENAVTLSHDGKDSYSVTKGEKTTINLDATLGGSPVNMDNVAIFAKGENTKVLNATVSRAADGSASVTFVGTAEGATNLIISAVYNECTTSISIPVKVTPRTDSYVYNFMKLQYGSIAADGYAPQFVTSFDMTTKGHVDEISLSVPSDPWMFDSASTSSELSWTSSSGGRGPSWIAPVGGWCSYRIRVEESGIFTPKTVYSQYTTIGNVSYYLAPVDAINPRDPLYFLDTVNGYSTTSKLDVSKTFTARYLEKGDYLLTMVMVGADDAAITEPAFYIKNFSLNRPGAGVPYTALLLDKTIQVGLTQRFNVVLEKDMLPLDASSATRLTVSSSKRTVATAKVVYSEDGKTAYVDITGRAEGETKITLTAVIDGVSASVSITVAVKSADALGEIAYTTEGTELNVGNQSQITVKAYSVDGNAYTKNPYSVTYKTSDSTIASVDSNGLITAHNQGRATIYLTFSDGIVETELRPVIVDVTGYSALESVEIENEEMVPVGNTLTLRFKGTLKYGAALPVDKATVTYTLVSASPAGAATLSGNKLTGVSAGTVTVRATVTFNGVTVTSANKTLGIRSGKTRSSYYTEEKRAIAMKNAEKYTWAEDIVKATVNAAETYVGREDTFWSMVTTQELPRNIRVGYRYDPKHNLCRYCGADIVALTGSNYAYTYNVELNPWKVQCPSCRNYFPSNDFASFYKSGIDANGNWSYALAKQNGAQYLKNNLYPEKGAGWGVDDGYGYRTGKNFSTGTGQTWEETHTYIAYYNHWALWYNGYLEDVMNISAMAYVYTGEAKYGRIAAVLVDRIADVYPAMDVGVYDPKYWNNGWYGGKILGGIWETGLVSSVAKAYDAVFDLYDDPEVVSFLSARASKYKMANKKTTGNMIRQNIDDNFLREAIKALNTKQIYGNFGFHQQTAATIAVVLDTLPETSNLLNWMMTGGGEVTPTILKNVSRDGAGNESSPSYNYGWASSMCEIANTLDGYDRYTQADLYSNPKIVKMMKMNFPLTLLRKGTAAIGDFDGVDAQTLTFGVNTLIPAFMRTGDVELGQMIYFLNGSTVAGAHGTIFTDTSKLQNKLQAVIDEHGEYPFDKSMQMTDYGFAVLRNGTKTDTEDTQQDFWMKYGSTQGHGHPAKLNLGIDAFGLALAPDMGYPSTTLGTNDIVNWERSTIIHNTVQVNNVSQKETYATENPLHFDHTDRVKVMDVDAPNAYDATSVYRRAVVMVDAGDGNSYGVDFFRIIGGSSHIYSFHALSNSVAETTGLNLVAQSGTYAGTSVAYGPGNVASGHDGLTSVKKDTAPAAKFAIDFAITDFRNHSTKGGTKHLRMTQMNDFTATDVATALGRPPIINGNPSWLQFALVRRTGSNLKSLFMTVFEPYCKERFIANEEVVSMMRTGGAAFGTNDAARAVKITLANGRVDYVMFSTNNAVTWKIDNKFAFQGAFGVLSMENGEVTYAYLNDGTKIGSYTMPFASYTGKVTDFTKGLAFENYITVSFNQAVDFSDLIGRFIDVNNSGIYNASYEIKGVTKISNTSAKLHLGDVTLTRNSASTYDIAVGQTFTIPRSATFEPVAAPEEPVEAVTFDAVGEQIAACDNVYTLTINATSSFGNIISYRMDEGPKGAKFDPLTKTLTWTPTEYGDYSATFTATGGSVAETITVPIKVRAKAPDLILGAQIRLKGVQGIRYIANMDRATLNRLESEGATEIEYGILLVPSASVQSRDEIVIGAVLNGNAVARVAAKKLYAITETHNQYTAVLHGIPETRFARNITARTYLTYRDKDGIVQTVYGNTSVARSIYQIAKAALGDADRYSESELSYMQYIVDTVEQ